MNPSRASFFRVADTVEGVTPSREARSVVVGVPPGHSKAFQIRGS